MYTDFDFPADDLDQTPVKPSVGPYAKTERFPCEHCSGSGNWRGRGKCYACGGKGYFLTSAADRRNSRVKRVASKAKQLADTRAAFDEQYPDVAPALREASSWNEFASDLQAKLFQYGSLTEPQVLAFRRTMAKAAETHAARSTERHTGDAVVDLSPIRAMFETARGSGYKKPIYRAAGLVITRAPDTGRNPGALYVTTEDEEYLGKIHGTAYTGKPAPGLTAIAADPRGEAIKHGQRTGSCSCCGRELTAENSIAAGIGPVCMQRWGL